MFLYSCEALASHKTALETCSVYTSNVALSKSMLVSQGLHKACGQESVPYHTMERWLHPFQSGDHKLGARWPVTAMGDVAVRALSVTGWQ